MTASEDLLKAAEYMSEHGWCQGMLEDADGRVCAAGAIRVVVCEGEDEFAMDPEQNDDMMLRSSSSVMRLHQYVLDEWGDKYPTVPAWNDDPKRTAEEVILALKRAGS